jgi:hypothetical protein
MNHDAFVRNVRSYRTQEDEAPEPAGRNSMLTGHTQVPRDSQDNISRDNPPRSSTVDNREHVDERTIMAGQPAGNVTIPYYGQRDDELSLSDITRTVQKNPLIAVALVGLGMWALIRYRAS